MTSTFDLYVILIVIMTKTDVTIQNDLLTLRRRSIVFCQRVIFVITLDSELDYFFLGKIGLKTVYIQK